jgi:hypothetical protein
MGRWLLAIGIVLGLGAFGVVAGTTLTTADKADDNAATARELAETVRQAAITGCERGNVVRALERIDSRQREDKAAERERSIRLYAILDCVLTVDRPAERGVRLPHPEEIKYIRIVAAIPPRLPVVEDRRVVGTKPPVPIP